MKKLQEVGPFVMNTKAEILQAVQDYHNDTFVK
jgi:redox-sensitive bicupin YhaK (pirin superfamily)